MVRDLPNQFHAVNFTSYVNVNFKQRMRMQSVMEKDLEMNRNSYSEMNNKKEHKDCARYSPTVHASIALNILNKLCFLFHLDREVA